MRRRTASLLSVALTLFGAVAHAEPSDAEKQLARQLMGTGRAQRALGDFRGALGSFSQAHRIMGVPTTLLETARALADVAELLEARTLLQQMPSLPSGSDEPAPFVRARTEAVELARSVNERVPHLRVDVSGAPEPDATELVVDGTVRADCREGCELNPGRHVVTARSGNARAVEQVRLAERERQTLELVFSPSVAVEELAPRSLPSSTPHATPRRPTRRHVPSATWVLGGIAVAGLTASAALGVETIQRHHTLQARCAPGCSEQELDGLERRALYTNIALGVGLGSAALAIASYFILPSAPPRPSRAQGWKVEAGADPRAGAGYVSLAGAF